MSYRNLDVWFIKNPVAPSSSKKNIWQLRMKRNFDISYNCFLHFCALLAILWSISNYTIFLLFSFSFTRLYFITEPSPLYDNNHYHEECLRCNSCGINLSGQNHRRARRFKNQILCDLHFADVALMIEVKY